MEDTLNQLKFINVLSPRGVHIPNCDKKGFYKKKQVRAICTHVFMYVVFVHVCVCTCINVVLYVCSRSSVCCTGHSQSPGLLS